MYDIIIPRLDYMLTEVKNQIMFDNVLYKLSFT